MDLSQYRSIVPCHVVYYRKDSFDFVFEQAETEITAVESVVGETIGLETFIRRIC